MLRMLVLGPILALAFAGPLHAEEPDPIAGTWTIITLLPTGDMESSLTITRDASGQLGATLKTTRGHTGRAGGVIFRDGVLRILSPGRARRALFEARVEGNRLRGHQLRGRQRAEALGARGAEAVAALRAERAKMNERGGDAEAHYDRAARRAMPRDGFPVLFDPTLVPAARATDIRDNEPVLGVSLGGEAKAYPLAIMGRHELANDTCGGRPITASW